MFYHCVIGNSRDRSALNLVQLALLDPLTHLQLVCFFNCQNLNTLRLNKCTGISKRNYRMIVIEIEMSQSPSEHADKTDKKGR